MAKAPSQPANFDPRITPARPDLAAAHLRGKVQAAQFVEGTAQEVVAELAAYMLVDADRNFASLSCVAWDVAEYLARMDFQSRRQTDRRPCSN